MQTLTHMKTNISRTNVKHSSDFKQEAHLGIRKFLRKYLLY